MLSVCPSAPQAKFFGILRCGNVFFAFQNGVFCSVLHPKSPKIFGLWPNGVQQIQKLADSWDFSLSGFGSVLADSISGFVELR